MVPDYTAFILIWGLDNTKRNWVHNDAGSYPMSSVVLICGSYSTQWHPVSVMQSWGILSSLLQLFRLFSEIKEVQYQAWEL